jgi:hypothetical protein
VIAFTSSGQVFRRGSKDVKSECRISNDECRMSNVEGMYSVYFKKKSEQSDSILRHSIFDILRFCGSLFPGSTVLRSRLQRDSLVLKSIQRSVINIRCSMLDVRCSTFNHFTVPGRRSFTRAPPLAANVQSDRRRNFGVSNKGAFRPSNLILCNNVWKFTKMTLDSCSFI